MGHMYDSVLLREGVLSAQMTPKLEARRTSTPSSPDDCPHCGADTANVQGLTACPECGWTTN